MTVPGRLPLALLLVLALSACSSGDADAGTMSAIRVVDAPSLPATVDALPDMDVDGYAVLLRELEGTPAVVNFWATWCDPCLREMPRLADAADRARDTIQFVGVDIADAREPARTFLRDLGITYPNVFDVEGAIRTSVGGVGQPVTAFYAADGELVRVVSGEVGADDLDRYLAEIGA
jgi:thiol-disulfide isomerase/thioredoxin